MLHITQNISRKCKNSRASDFRMPLHYTQHITRQCQDLEHASSEYPCAAWYQKMEALGACEFTTLCIVQTITRNARIWSMEVQNTFTLRSHLEHGSSEYLYTTQPLGAWKFRIPLHYAATWSMEVQNTFTLRSHLEHGSSEYIPCTLRSLLLENASTWSM